VSNKKEGHVSNKKAGHVSNKKSRACFIKKVMFQFRMFQIEKKGMIHVKNKSFKHV
jgi:hypothetical protein